MRIGIIGAGSVGGTLGRGWAERGHQVVFGVRDPSQPKVAALLKEAGGRASAAPVAQAAASGDVVVLATPWSGTREALKSAGDLRHKVLFDCTNPLKPDLTGLELGLTTSAGEQIQAWAPGAKVVKVFNTTGFKNMASPLFGREAATMFFCGDDGPAKSVAAQLARELGFDPIDAGPLASARLLEPLAMLWVHLAVAQRMGPDIAFKLLRR